MKNSFDGITVISGGYIGEKDTLIVNNSADPKEVIGVSDGYGNFKKKLSKKNFLEIKKLKKYLKI